MKALFVAITLLTAASSFAQTAPTVTSQPGQQAQTFAPPPGQATGTAPPNSFALQLDTEFRRGRRGTLVVVDREDMEQRLARLEQLLGEASERGRGWGNRGKLREAYDQLNDIREALAQSPDLRSYNPRPTPPPPPPPPMYQPIAEGALRNVLNAMSREPFADDKMNILQDVSDDNFFLVGQVQQVLSQFQFSRDRLKAVRLLWNRVLDKQNGFQLYGAFQFSSDKEELKRIISG